MFHYYDPSESPEKTTDAFVAVVCQKQETTATFIEELGDLLHFPGYSGRNFDAFWDSAREFDGIAEKRIILVHRELPRLEKEDLLTYIGLLRDLVLYWRRHASEHVFDVWFPSKDKKRVAELLHLAPSAYEGD